MIQESGVGVWGKNSFFGLAFKKNIVLRLRYTNSALQVAPPSFNVYNAWGRCAFDGPIRLSISSQLYSFILLIWSGK